MKNITALTSESYDPTLMYCRVGLALRYIYIYTVYMQYIFYNVRSELFVVKIRLGVRLGKEIRFCQVLAKMHDWFTVATSRPEIDEIT